MERHDHLTVRPEARKIRSKGVLVENEKTGVCAWIPYKESPYEMIDSDWDNPKLFAKGKFGNPDIQENRHVMKTCIDVFMRRIEAMDEMNDMSMEQLEFANQNLEEAIEKVEQEKEAV